MNFACSKEIPLADDQLLIAGVIDTLTNFVEHPEVVADRIERIAGAIGDPRRVLAGTDCGFDTSAGMGRVTEDVVWAKLRALTRRRAARIEAAVHLESQRAVAYACAATPRWLSSTSGRAESSSGVPSNTKRPDEMT